jgi:hypothetical protein
VTDANDRVEVMSERAQVLSLDGGEGGDGHVAVLMRGFARPCKPIGKHLADGSARCRIPSARSQNGVPSERWSAAREPARRHAHRLKTRL